MKIDRLKLLATFLVLTGLLLTLQPVFADGAAGSGSVSLTSLGSAYNQNFDSLAVAATSNVLPTGWYLTEVGTNAAADGLYVANDGTSNTGNVYSYGATGITERALGMLLSGTNTPCYALKKVDIKLRCSE